MPLSAAPFIAQHETWVSLDPIQGCPAACSYCYLGPLHQTRQRPQALIEPAALYDSLLASPYLDKRRLSAAGGQYPICIGNYTDMCMTPANRAYLLAVLDEHQRRLPNQPLCVITKAVLGADFLAAVAARGVRVVFFISLAFLAPHYEQGAPPYPQRLVNFERIAHHPTLRAVHFWRPITPLSAPTPDAIPRQLETLIEHGASLSVVTGLKYGDSLAAAFQHDDHPLQAYFNQHQRHTSLTHEIFDPTLKRAVLDAARLWDYPIYFHTSCALSYLWGQPDFSATFRPPHLEAVCKPSYCPAHQRQICGDYRQQQPHPDPITLEEVAAEVAGAAVYFDAEREVIEVAAPLTQAQQTYLTQATRFTVRGRGLVTTLEWIGSIHRKENLMQVAELIEKTREIIRLFKEVEPRAWGVEAMAVELTAETGTLADTIMIQEGYRRLRAGGEIDLEDDIVDIMFMLIRIADHYGIDIEAAYLKMLDITRTKIERRIQEKKQSG